ncbi:MAG: tRNA pseudouridine(38-40) synthase TruA [Gemmatimonadaceae bacterium]
MAQRTIQLVLHYDGAGFAGWQRQPAARTVQGAVEDALGKVCGQSVTAIGAGRTDAGVHARGQAVGVRVVPKWIPSALRRALNATLPKDIWVAAAHEMRDEFHARHSALARRYRYVVGTVDEAGSPFRRSHELVYRRPLDRMILDRLAAALVGHHSFRAFAVRGTAPEDDDHVCDVREAAWYERAGGLAFEIEANRFLHRMVRFIVGTMLDSASGRRDPESMLVLLAAGNNRSVSPPAAAHGLWLERVRYPADLYCETA